MAAGDTTVGSTPTWEHINLTGDYIWNYDRDAIGREFRPLRLSPQYRIAA
jgi:hypothetical protein